MDTTVTRVNPHPYLRIVGHCYVEYGYPCATAPNQWQSLGGPEVLTLGAVYAFSGRHHKSRPVLYIGPNERAARLTGVYQLLRSEAFEQGGFALASG